MTDIFISYARDDQPKVTQLAAALEAAGYSVWWDLRIQSGSEFARDIETALAGAKAVIVCWSAAADESRWVKDEANSGAEANKLFAISLDGALPPIGFRQFHCTDFSNWRGNEGDACFKSLDDAIRGLISGTVPRPPVSRPMKRTGTGNARFIAIMLLLAVMGLGAVAFIFRAQLFDGSPAKVETTANTRPPVLAVAPLRVSDDSLSGIGGDLSESIAAGLSRFSLFTVVRPGDGGNQADYRLEGSLQREGEMLRLTARLVEVVNGKEVWGRTYDRDVSQGSLLAAQDDLRAQVVAAVGDPYGAMLSELQQQVIRKDPQTLSPFEAVLRHSIYRQRLGLEDHKITRDVLERAAKAAPDDANVLAALAAIRIEEVKHNYNRRPDSGAMALDAARRAVRADPKNSYAYFELAEVQYFLKDPDAFRAAAERAFELNPFDSEAVAMLGILSGYAGDWDRGKEWTGLAMKLNPDHPGWYNFTNFFDAYLHGQYEDAYRIAQRINQPEYFPDAYVQTIALVRLGRIDEAKAKANDFVRLWPARLSEFRNRNLDVWMYALPDLQDKIMTDLTAAGVDFSQ